MARTYYIRNDDGSIGRTSNLLSVARDNGFDDTYTDEEIVYFGGKKYLASEITSLPQYMEVNKEEKQAELRNNFNLRKSNVTCMSSLGYEIDAGNQAFIDMLGQWFIMWRRNIPDAEFTDANNVTHAVTFEEVETIVTEIIMNGRRLYGTKWTIRDEIKASETKEELDQIDTTI